MKAARLILSVAVVVASLIAGLAAQGKTEAMLIQYRDIMSKMDSAFAAADTRGLENVEAQINAFVLLPGEDRHEWRRDKLQLWLGALDRAHSAIDPNFGPADRPSLNIAPRATPGVVYDSGVDPSEIKDPAVRREYEQRLAANSQKAQKARFQSALEQLKERWTTDLKAYVSSQYSGSEADVGEIDVVLDQHISDVEFRAGLRASLLKALR